MASRKEETREEVRKAEEELARAKGQHADSLKKEAEEEEKRAREKEKEEEEDQ